MMKAVTDNKQSRGFMQRLPLIMAFLIPVLILLVIYIGRGVYPFGSNTYLRSDMYHQYAPFMREFQRNIQQGGSLLYSFNTGLGTDLSSTYAYYLASPLNWLVGLFPNTLVPEFMNIMIILKSGLMSLLFSWYLIKKYKRNDYTATVFGCFYALSSYMAAFSWNVMWLDCLVLLPLILFGLESLVKRGKTRMYILSLAACIISNYYISIMICIFLIFYYIYLIVCEKENRRSDAIIYSSCTFVLCSLLAGCMALFIVLPAFFHLFITASAASSFPSSMTAYYNLLEMLSHAVINSDTQVFSGHFPNIYSTMALFVLVPLYWVSRRVPAREKAGKTALLMLLAFSFMFNVTTYIWHGFHFPNSLPCRYSFIFIFIALSMGYHAIINIRRFTTKEIVLFSAVGAAGVFLMQALYTDSISLENAALGAGFIVLYMIICLFLKKRTIRKTAVMVMLLVVSVAEMMINTNATGYSTTSRTYYVADNDDIRALLNEVDDGSFFRVEKADRKTKNDGTWNDYRSASIFSSTTVAGDSDLYNALGMQGRTNAYSFSGRTPVSQALLGVRYLISKNGETDRLLTERSVYGEHHIYEYRYALPLGFMVDEAMLSTQVYLSDPFRFQNELIFNSCGVEGIFTQMGSLQGESFSFTAEDEGRCLIFLSGDADSVTVTVEKPDRVSRQSEHDDLELTEIIDAGDVSHGDKVSVNVTDPEGNSVTAYPAVMDYEKYYEAMSRLSSEVMEVEEFSDTYIRGRVNSSEGKMLFTTIPFDPGWTMYVDGEKTESVVYEEAFMAASLTEGMHTVEFRFWPKGLTPGIIISSAAVIGYIVFSVVLEFRKKKRKIQ